MPDDYNNSTIQQSHNPTKCAYIFPGQGSQSVGMGRELYDSYPEAKELFDKANDILKFELTKLCFEGPKEELTTTANSQVAILVHSLAALRVLEKYTMQQSNDATIQQSNDPTIQQKYVPSFGLGLSLGEYTALVASGCLTFEDGVKLVRKRGQFMQAASEKNPGKMASIIGMEMGELEKLCKGFGCEIANLNCPGQVVISGSSSSVELTANMAKQKGAKRAIMLEVSGAFHSSLMTPARDKLEKVINETTFNPPKYPIISNVTAEPTKDPETIKKNLIEQVNTKTLFEASIRYLAAQGINTYLEIGPGTVLKGLLRKIDKGLNVFNFEKPSDYEALLATDSSTPQI